MKKPTFFYNIAFSREESEIIIFLNSLKKNLGKNDKVICLTDKVTSKNTINIIKKFTKKNKKFISKHCIDTKTFAETKLKGLRLSVNNCDYIIDMDGNGAHNPLYLPLILKKIYSKKYDAVVGSRFLSGGKYIGKINRYFLSYFGTILSNLILNMSYTDATGGYICISKKITKIFLTKKIYSKSHFYHVELKNCINQFNYLEIPIIYKKSNSAISPWTTIMAVINLFRVKLDNIFIKKQKIIYPS